jgi:hypothetical protein
MKYFKAERAVIKNIATSGLNLTEVLLRNKMKRIQILKRHDTKNGRNDEHIFTEILMILMGLENTDTSKNHELTPVPNKRSLFFLSISRCLCTWVWLMESFIFFNFVLKMKVEIALRSMGNLIFFLPSF